MLEGGQVWPQHWLRQRNDQPDDHGESGGDAARQVGKAHREQECYDERQAEDETEAEIRPSGEERRCEWDSQHRQRRRPFA